MAGWWANNIGNGNTFTQSVANVITPNNDTQYVGGKLETIENNANRVAAESMLSVGVTSVSGNTNENANTEVVDYEIVAHPTNGDLIIQAQTAEEWEKAGFENKPAWCYYEMDTKNGKIFSIAQWYPRMCVYDDVNGWNTTPYTGPGEFYLEYGDFDIKITSPANHIVVCSGELQNESEVYTLEQQKRWAKAKNSETTVLIRGANEVTNLDSRPSKKSTLTWHYKIANSRDVSWASSAAFIIDAASINLPSGKKAMTISAYPLESNGNNAWERSTEYTKASIENYSKYFLRQIFCPKTFSQIFYLSTYLF